MANKRNIAALIQALRGSRGLPVGIPLEALARHLADAGVLAPAALTDDEAVAIAAEAAGTVPTLGHEGRSLSSGRGPMRVGATAPTSDLRQWFPERSTSDRA